MASENKNPYLNPILHHAEALSAAQRRTIQKIGFWALFAYMEGYALGFAAIDLLVSTIAGAVIVGIFRGSSLGRHPHFAALHIGILGAMATSLINRQDVILGIDFALLLCLSVLFISRGTLVLLGAVAAEHVLGIAFDSWSSISLMKSSPVLAGYVVARALALGMLGAIGLRQFLLTREPEEQLPLPDPPKTSGRPLTVAEWEAKNQRDA